MNQRLPRSLRIQKGNEIRQILSAGQKYIGNYLIIYCLASEMPNSPTRVGVLSPKRLGKANLRNRLRRRMREVFRRHRAEMHGSHQILMMGRTSAVTAGYQAVRDDFLMLCQKSRLLPSRDT